MCRTKCYRKFLSQCEENCLLSTMLKATSFDVLILGVRCQERYLLCTNNTTRQPKYNKG